MSLPKNAEVVARECRFAINIPTKFGGRPDVHMVKEICHTADGKQYPNIKLVKDYKRPFYITKPSKRVYKDKRECEDLDNLLKTECTQSELRDRVAKALDKAWSKDRLPQLAASPYLFGTDISSTALIKKHYQTRWPDKATPFSVAVFDIETDVVHGTKDILMCTIVLGGKVFTSVLRSFITGISDVHAAVDVAMEKYLGDYIVKRNLECELAIGDTVADVISLCINKAHEWKPDLLAIWNMDFDIPKVLENLELAGVDPTDIFSDPAVPKPFRLYSYRQGAKKKITAAGKVIPISPAAQWHTLISTSSFYVIDAMCMYKMLRLSEPEQPSYALDAILQKRLGIRKLKFKEADEYQGLRWHQFMQTYYKVEYIVYNRFDCISMQELDEETKDLSHTFPEFSGVSDFCDFRSQPKRIADALHSFCLERGKVMGTVYKEKLAMFDVATDVVDDDTDEGGEETDDNDSAEPMSKPAETMGLDGWVCTLAPHLTTENGAKCILEDENMRTNLRFLVYDIDAVAAYPSCVESENVSKATTKREVITVEGVDEYTFRMQNINLMSGRVNGLEYAQTMFGLPTPFELLAMYQAKKA